MKSLSLKSFLGIGVLAAVVLVALNYHQIEIFLQAKFNQYLTYSVCDRPIHLKIGSIDDRFGISEANLSADIGKAAQIWDQSSGKQLFILDNSKGLKINLIYDKRTALSNQINNLSGNLKQSNQSLQANIDAYHLKVADFKNKLADFNSKVDALNREIESWNQKGGAPPDEYQKLITQQNDLKNQQASLQVEADSLNQMAQNLNLSTQDYNVNVRQLNSTINAFDEALSQKPEEGLFDPSSDSIDIYFNNNYNELIHTLAHEMGHALGLRHNLNKLSIMYPYSTQTTMLSQNDLSSLNSICSVRILNIPYLQKIQEIVGQWSGYFKQ